MNIMWLWVGTYAQGFVVVAYHFAYAWDMLTTSVINCILM